MSLAHAILGLLQQEEMTGYDLKNTCFDQTIAHLWSADQAQIYRTLDKLEQQDWVHCTVEVQHDRPNRKVYRITDTGKAELERWLQSDQPIPTIRDPLLIQIYFAAQLPNSAILNLLKQQLIAHEKKLADCKAIELPPPTHQSANREQMMQRLAQELAISREQAYLDWLNRAIELMQQDEGDNIT
jgi:PadR family transcriptional regulator, regulatory protein AphA